MQASSSAKYADLDSIMSNPAKTTNILGHESNERTFDLDRSEGFGAAANESPRSCELYMVQDDSVDQEKTNYSHNPCNISETASSSWANDGYCALEEHLPTESSGIEESIVTADQSIPMEDQESMEYQGGSSDGEFGDPSTSECSQIHGGCVSENSEFIDSAERAYLQGPRFQTQEYRRLLDEYWKDFDNVNDVQLADLEHFNSSEEQESQGSSMDTLENQLGEPWARSIDARIGENSPSFLVNGGSDSNEDILAGSSMDLAQTAYLQGGRFQTNQYKKMMDAYWGKKKRHIRRSLSPVFWDSGRPQDWPNNTSRMARSEKKNQVKKDEYKRQI
uniref:Erect panicle 2 protein n=1 Tax=Caenorhabditis tropicalis TaxID=1561998 RepID=A0A1I7V0Q6_9PELO